MMMIMILIPKTMSTTTISPDSNIGGGELFKNSHSQPKLILKMNNSDEVTRLLVHSNSYHAEILVMDLS